LPCPSGQRPALATALRAAIITAQTHHRSGATVCFNAGFLPIYNLRSLPRRIKLGLLTSAFSILIVAIAAIEQDEIATIIDDRVAEEGIFESMGYTLTSDQLTVDLTGPNYPAGAHELRNRLRPAVSAETLIDVRFFEYTPLIPERGTNNP
jgi:hypothetical protein